MGTCISSLMEQRNHRSLVPDAHITDFRMRAVGSFMCTVPNSATEKCSDVYRLSGYTAKEHADFCRRACASDNMYTLLMKICSERTTRRAIAYRPVDRVEKEVTHDPVTGKSREVEITFLQPTVMISYTELQQSISALGCGLASLGVSRQASVALYLDTCHEWLEAVFAIWSQDMIAVTVYANLGREALAYAIRETESRVIICDARNVGLLRALMKADEIPQVPIIYVGTLPDQCWDGVTLYGFNDMVAIGKEASVKEAHPSTGPSGNEAIALIMYTSGTTGDPKGVMHSHGALAAGAAAFTVRLHDHIGSYTEGETYCAYLPMAHIMEFTVTTIFIARGALVGFGTPRTLTGMYARPHGDMCEFEPTVFFGVPRIYDTLKKAVESKLPPPGTFKRRIFDMAYQSRLESLKKGLDTPYYNAQVFGAARAVLGRRLQSMLSGGGPLCAPTQEFVSVVFGTIVVGWGLTETICVGAIQLLGDMEPYTAGLLLPTEEVKLLDTEEYKHTDIPEPRGEICVRGPFMFKGYYKQPELTKEVLDEEGWFRTGDVGSITKDGKLRIIGRVKALAKNVLGEYIALETLESLYASNSLVDPNGVCVLVHPEKTYIAALVLTSEGRVRTFAQEHGLSGSFPEILDDPAFLTAATASLVQTAKQSHRMPFEWIRRVRFLTDEWTPENNLLTAAMKLKRRVIDVHYAKEIAELFQGD